VPGEDRLDDVGAETGKRQESADAGSRPSSAAELSEKNLPGDQLPHPLVGSRNDVDEMLVSAWRLRM
jgi:hypothetical protein